MKKHTKGALAAGTAAVLLLGGAGSLAYWSDSAAVGGSDIATGHLSLSDASSTGWVHADGELAGQDVTSIVPGDSISQEFTFTINASGDNLAAELTTPESVEAEIGGDATPTTLELPVSATYTIDGSPAPATISEANDGDVVTVVVEVDFPFGDVDTVNANDTQDLVASLDDLTVQLTQLQPGA